MSTKTDLKQFIDMEQSSKPVFGYILFSKQEKMWYQFFYDMIFDEWSIRESKYYFFKKNMNKFGRYKANN